MADHRGVQTEGQIAHGTVLIAVANHNVLGFVVIKGVVHEFRGGGIRRAAYMHHDRHMHIQIHQPRAGFGAARTVYGCIVKIVHRIEVIEGVNLVQTGIASSGVIAPRRSPGESGGGIIRGGGVIRAATGGTCGRRQVHEAGNIHTIPMLRGGTGRTRIQLHNIGRVFHRSAHQPGNARADIAGFFFSGAGVKHMQFVISCDAAAAIHNADIQFVKMRQDLRKISGIIAGSGNRRQR